jgi:hypothetical protein
MTAIRKAMVVLNPRPYRTFYYGIRSASTEWSKIGHAKTGRGAVRAAVMHIFDRKYHIAIVHDEAGDIVYRILRIKGAIHIVRNR